MSPPPQLHHPPPPALGHHSSGASSLSAGSPASIAQQDIGWLLGQPWVAKPQQRPCPAKGWPWLSKGTEGQGQVVRVGGVAKSPLLLAAGLPQPWATGSAQPPRRACSSPLLGPTLAGQRPPSPLPRWQCPAPTASAPPHPPPPRAAMPAPCLSPGVAVPQRVPFPRPSHWWAAPT